MLIRMRTTLVLDDALLAQVKRRALERKMTVSDVVNEALRDSLGRSRPTAAPFTLVTYGRGGERVRHEPGDFDVELETQDEDRLR